MTTPDQADFARRVLNAEADAIRHITIDDSFQQAVNLIIQHDDGSPRTGSLIISGLGKSGLIGQKLSATFASTGTPSQFLHPSEAVHGDLGRIRRGDTALLLSYGGNTEEVVTLAELLRQDSLPTLALVGKPDCDLARLATVTLTVGDVTEACPLNLAPTASTTAMLALGDALALAVARQRNFGVEQFRKLHPGGGLGRQLTPVTQAMRFKAAPPADANLPLIHPDRTVEQAYAEAEQFAKASGLRRAGALLIVDDQGKLAGIVTDGDLRTALIRQGPDAWLGPIRQIMTTHPTTLPIDALVRDAVRIVREHRFDEIPIVDENHHPVGLIDVQDLAALKVIEG
ncbi:SIS domain-containing protein [Phycisphaerales bacterium AB-hyl4]|uniref:SIS domain-containing protein n=1 Tax=Natronomicrosphaera hydrolytica TaxID=3242702 RepID=A0ABV4UAH5_9BACT